LPAQLLFLQQVGFFMCFKHVSVMPKEVLEYLNCTSGKVYVDCTLGGAGHARCICDKIYPDGIFIGMDQDLRSVINAEKVLEKYKPNVHLFHENFANIGRVLSELNIPGVDGIVADLGISLDQLNSNRGFSFKRDDPLDMRMDSKNSVTAEKLINCLEEKELRKLFKRYGEEPWAGPIARKIVKTRTRRPIVTGAELAKLVVDAVPAGRRKKGIHPATRIFMALRIAVNRELEMLDKFMKTATDCLNQKGRLCVISFHSLEDRIVKQGIKYLEKECVCPRDFPECICEKIKSVRCLTAKPVQPAKEEVSLNPLARSAKLRSSEKL
jgi:16S rRNA (cytosine1402-N4)-methyltransferase